MLTCELALSGPLLCEHQETCRKEDREVCRKELEHLWNLYAQEMEKILGSEDDP